MQRNQICSIHYSCVQFRTNVMKCVTAANAPNLVVTLVVLVLVMVVLVLVMVALVAYKSCKSDLNAEYSYHKLHFCLQTT